MPMNPEYKQKWIEALKSGEYNQDRGYLKSKSGYCCLGVLCEVAGATWNVSGFGSPLEQPSITSSFMGHEYKISLGHVGTLSQDGEKLFGLSSDDTQLLMNMNDVYDASFSEIADYIEVNL